MNRLNNKIKFLANRSRCPECNGNYFLFIMTDDIRFRASIHGKLSTPHYIRPGRFRSVMGINKPQRLEACQVMTRLCINCGGMRKMGIKSE